MAPGAPLTKLLAAALFLAALAGCGGGSGESAEDLYGVYRSTEDERNRAEQALRRSFSEIALAAEQRDAAGVREAAERGREAAEEIESLLEREIAAAQDLGGFSGLAAAARRLERGLDRSLEGVRLFLAQLEIADEDPFLENGGNAAEVGGLAQEAARLSSEGELAVRRADRALAEALGIQPRPDILLDRPATTTGSG
jgi:hypothetical protein